MDGDYKFIFATVFVTHIHRNYLEKFGMKVLGFQILVVLPMVLLSGGQLAPDRSKVTQKAVADAKSYVNDFEINEMLLQSGAVSGGPSQKAIDHRRARLLYEEAVRRAGNVMGSPLTLNDLKQIYNASGCQALVAPPSCLSSTVNQFRTIDGTCNNLQQPLWGAASTTFRRVLPPFYDNGISSMRGNNLSANFNVNDSLRQSVGPFLPPFPNARVVSANIVRDRPFDETGISHMAMQWGQFITHDIASSPVMSQSCSSHCNNTDVCSPITVLKEDEAFGLGTLRNGSCIPFTRTVPGCGDLPRGPLDPRQQINDATSFLDGSTIYGSDQNVSTTLREWRAGLLRVTNNIHSISGLFLLFIRAPNRKSYLPTDSSGGFMAGDKRVNDHTALTVMHTIWLREHNRVAGILGAVNLHWDDERIFQEAKKFVGAEIQKITYYEYLPTILGQQWFDTLIGMYRGYNASLNPAVSNEFAAGAFRFGHSLVRPSFSRLDKNRNDIIGNISLLEAFTGSSFVNSAGTDPILQGLLNDNARQRDEFITSTMTERLFESSVSAYNPIPNSPGLDVVALTVQRGRDHGLPLYLAVKDYCLNKYNLTSGFDHDLTMVRLLQTYGSTDMIDFYIGGLSEKSLPGSILGSTFACIVADTFYNLRNGDRFYFENPSVFTPEQRAEIANKTSLSKVICDDGDDIGSIQKNSFLTNQQLTPCSSFSAVNFSLWKETCYVKVAAVAGDDNLIINIVSKSVYPYANISTESVLAFKTVKGCLAIQCPSINIPCNVTATAYTSPNSNIDVTILNNRRLPKTDSDDSYHALWHNSHLDTSCGLYRSQKACLSGTATGIVYTVAKK